MKRFIFNCVVLLITIFLAVVFLEFLAKSLEGDSPKTLITQEHFTEKDSVYGYVLVKNASWNSVKSLENGSIVYNVTYSTDRFGRRSWPSLGVEKSAPAIVFFGCSVTFGEGLDVQDTFPYMVESAKKYQVFNYAVPGYGPSQMLAKMQSGSLEREIPKDSDTVFVFIPAHVNRVIGNSLAPWLYDGPMYVYENESVQLKGSFRSVKPKTIEFYEWFNSLKTKSSFLRLSRLEFPPWGTKEDIRTTAEVIIESKRLYESRFTGSFIVLFHPEWYRTDDKRTHNEFIRLLQEANVSIIDYSDFKYSDEYVIPFDQHPNAELNKEMTGLFIEDFEVLANLN